MFLPGFFHLLRNFYTEALKKPLPCKGYGGFFGMANGIQMESKRNPGGIQMESQKRRKERKREERKRKELKRKECRCRGITRGCAAATATFYFFVLSFDTSSVFASQSHLPLEGKAFPGISGVGKKVGSFFPFGVV